MPEGELRDLASLECAQFAACLGHSFRLDESGATLVLVSADPLGAAAPAGRRQPFSLVFRGPHAPALPQRIHRLENAHLGSLDVFLVPIQPDAEGRRYEAVFA